MAPERTKRKKSPVHRFGLTHGREGVPKFIRENTDQFFAAATRRKSKIISASKPIISTESREKQITQGVNEAQKKVNPIIKLIAKPTTPIVVLPPIRTTTTSNTRPKTVSSSDICNRQPILPSFIPSPSDSYESSTPLIKSPSLITTSRSLPKRQFHHGGPVDPDIFRKAYERAISVARSRLLFHDPYSLTRASATHGVLYSYYDHTPMCIFSHGTTCNHRQDKTDEQDRKTKSNLRKKIFDNVVVEHYIQQ